MPRMLTTLILALGLALGFTACDSDDDSHDEHHLEAFGVALVMGTDTLVMSTSGEASEVEGRLDLHVGQARGPVLLHFLDEEGHWFRPEADPDGEHAFALTHDASDFTTTQDAAAWSFTATGVAAGASTVVVRVLHEGHDDYVSPALPVQVSE